MTEKNEESRSPPLDHTAFHTSPEKIKESQRKTYLLHKGDGVDGILTQNTNNLIRVLDKVLAGSFAVADDGVEVFEVWGLLGDVQIGILGFKLVLEVGVKTHGDVKLISGGRASRV